MSAVHWAAYFKDTSVELLKLYSLYGADFVTLKTGKGLTALDIARERKNEVATQFIENLEERKVAARKLFEMEVMLQAMRLEAEKQIIDAKLTSLKEQLEILREVTASSLSQHLTSHTIDTTVEKIEEALSRTRTASTFNAASVVDQYLVAGDDASSNFAPRRLSGLKLLNGGEGLKVCHETSQILPTFAHKESTDSYRLVDKPENNFFAPVNRTIQIVTTMNDVFISHNWGDPPDYKNHERVSKFARALKDRGFVVWIDYERLTGNILAQISDGLARSRVFVACITRQYMAKIKAGSQVGGKDWCEVEFSEAVMLLGKSRMIPIVFESESLKPEEWWGPVGTMLRGSLYIDYCADDRLPNAVETLADRLILLKT